MAKFKPEVLERIGTDPDLFAAVCKGMDIKPSAMANTLRRNGKTLNRPDIVRIVAAYLQKEPDEIRVTDCKEETNVVQENH